MWWREIACPEAKQFPKMIANLNKGGQSNANANQECKSSHAIKLEMKLARIGGRKLEKLESPITQSNGVTFLRLHYLSWETISNPRERPLTRQGEFLNHRIDPR